MRLGDAFGLLEVGDGARHAQDAVVGAARPLEVFHRLFQVCLAGLVGLAEMIDLARGQVLVALALAPQLDVGRCLHAGGDDGGRFAIGVGAEHLRIDGCHFHLHVDAVQQRAGHAALIAPDQVRRAVADAADVARIAARAGVHGGDQLEVRRELGLPGGARNRDAAGFHRLAQHVQHSTVKFRKFVEEQHAAVRQRNLTGTRHAAAANQGDAGTGVVRRPERPALPVLDAEAARQRLHGRRLQRFLVGHGRQQADEAGGQHGLAGARRPDQQDAVIAGRRHLQRPLDHQLALDVGKVQVVRLRQQLHRLMPRQHGVGGLGAEVAAHLQQRLRRVDGGIGHQRRFVGVGHRQDEGQPAAVAPGRQRHRQRAAYRPQFARQRQLSGEFILVQAGGRNLLGRGQDAERDRQIEASSYRLLPDCGRLSFIL
jgi:hypothetical protein